MDPKLWIEVAHFSKNLEGLVLQNGTQPGAFILVLKMGTWNLKCLTKVSWHLSKLLTLEGCEGCFMFFGSSNWLSVVHIEWMISIWFFVCNFFSVISTSLTWVQDTLVILILGGGVYQKNDMLSSVIQCLELFSHWKYILKFKMILVAFWVELTKWSS